MDSPSPRRPLLKQVLMNVPQGRCVEIPSQTSFPALYRYDTQGRGIPITTGDAHHVILPGRTKEAAAHSTRTPLE
jgi:hypothetical protein